MYQGHELITPREIIIVTIVWLWSVLGPCWRGCRGYLGTWGLVPRRGGGHGVRPSDAKHFANVQVGAIRVQLGVVVREDGCVDIVGRRHNVAVVIGPDHVRSRAVLARSPQAQGLARKEVRAIRVDRGV
jgi:hypothetical protein